MSGRVQGANMLTLHVLHVLHVLHRLRHSYPVDDYSLLEIKGWGSNSAWLWLPP